MDNEKDVATRVKEAIEVKNRLRKCGLLMMLGPEPNAIFVKRMNAFVRDGQSSAFWLQDDVSKLRARVSLNACLGSESGVVLEVG